MLISLLVRCGFTMRYTTNPAMAEVATTAKNTNANTDINNFVYQSVGDRISSRMYIVTRATGLAHHTVLSSHRCVKNRNTLFTSAGLNSTALCRISSRRIGRRASALRAFHVAVAESAIIKLRLQDRSPTHEYSRPSPNQCPPARAPSRRRSAPLARRAALGLSRRTRSHQTLSRSPRPLRLCRLRKWLGGRLFLLCPRRTKRPNRRPLRFSPFPASRCRSAPSRRNALLHACSPAAFPHRSAAHALRRPRGPSLARPRLHALHASIHAPRFASRARFKARRVRRHAPRSLERPSL